MTLVRIFALSLLLGASLGGLVWFAWGVLGNMFKSGKAEPVQNAPVEDATKEKGSAAKKPA